MTVYGYARHSDGLPIDQIQDLESYGCAKVFSDIVTGTKTGPGWASLIQTVKRGDTVGIA